MSRLWQMRQIERSATTAWQPNSLGSSSHPKRLSPAGAQQGAAKVAAPPSHPKHLSPAGA
ncbi:hypothetical protein GCM10025785_19610 [Corynebacterium canis]